MLDIQPAIDAAGPEEIIHLVPGMYKKFKVQNEYDENTFLRIIGDIVDLPPQLSMPIINKHTVGGSNTISLNTEQRVVLKNLIVEIGDTAGLMCYTNIENQRVGLKNVHFDGGWNADLNAGRKDAKWGVRSNEVVKWVAENVTANNIYREHGFYHTINGLRKRIFNSTHCIAKRTGRTQSQYVSYDSDPQPDEVEINLVHSIGVDNCLTTGGGGSAYTFRGGFPKAKIYMDHCLSLQGMDPTLHATPGNNICGGLVCDNGPKSWDRDKYSCDELVINGGKFLMGKYYPGVGSARRQNLKIKNPRKLTMGGITATNYPDAHPVVLEIESPRVYGLTPGPYTFKAADKYIGRCVFDGETFDDYNSMLNSIQYLPFVTVL